MSKNLYQFAALTGNHAREALRIVAAHPAICDPTTGVRFLAAFERGDDVLFESGPVDELDAVIAAALHDEPAMELAFYRCVLDSWNRTALSLHPWVAERWPHLEAMWITFLSTGAAVCWRDHKEWLQLAPRPTGEEIGEAIEALYPEREDARAFLDALFDWLHWCRETDGVGVMTARTLGPSTD